MQYSWLFRVTEPGGESCSRGSCAQAAGLCDPCRPLCPRPLSAMCFTVDCRLSAFLQVNYSTPQPEVMCALRVLFPLRHSSLTVKGTILSKRVPERRQRHALCAPSLLRRALPPSTSQPSSGLSPGRFSRACTYGRLHAAAKEGAWGVQAGFPASWRASISLWPPCCSSSRGHRGLG